MEAPWRQVAGGRGRARGRAAVAPAAGNGVQLRGAGGGREKAAAGAAGSVPSPGGAGTAAAAELTSHRKFEEIKKANQAAAKKLVEEHFSSSSEEEGDEDFEGKQGKIVANTFTTYTTQTDGDIRELERTKQYLNEAFQAGAMTCLICIASVKRNQAVWSCSGCFCIFHMPCIQKWAKDSQFLVSSLTDDDFGKKDYPWPCPKCRFEYKQSDTPTRYYCYCGKVEDPPLDPWLVPHSCGQVCEREFKPPCGHKCLLLCHPGPCPPCPKMVTTSCYCKKAKPIPRRCSAKEWSCQLPCGRKLLCGQHKCENPCHAGSCQPCPRVSRQKCVCGKQIAERSCASPVWHCEQRDTRVLLSCGLWWCWGLTLRPRILRFVEEHCHVVTIHVNKFAMLVLVENVLDLGKGSVLVRSQSFLCLVQKMYQLVATVVTNYLNVESIDVHSAVTEVLVKHVDKKWKNSVAVESIQNECHAINLTCVKLNVLRCVTVRNISVEESVALETAQLVIKTVDEL